MDDTRKPLSVGHKIAGYSVVREIGAGGFGIVYEAFNYSTEERVAIKQFYPQAIASWRQGTIVVSKADDRDLVEKVLTKFEREATLQFKLDHPNILKVKNFIRENNTGYLITEFIDGTTLVKFLEQYGHVCPDQGMFRGTMEPIADALHYLHEKLTLHRDISPENIMIDSRGRPVLVDFGAAKRDLRLSSSVSTVVQFREDYAPIEQQVPSEERPEGAYTDVFEFAGTMYRMLAGRPPERAVVRSLAIKDPYVPMAKAAKVVCSDAVFTAIDRGLNLAIADRPQTIEQFLQIMGWRGGSPPPPPKRPANTNKTPDPPPPVPPVQRLFDEPGAPRQRSRVGAYLTVLALAVAVVAALFFFSKDPSPVISSSTPSVPARTPSVTQTSTTPDNTYKQPSGPAPTYTQPTVPTYTQPKATYTPPPPPPPPRVSFTTYANYDMEGGDLAGPPQLYGEQPECEVACDGNSLCIGYAYDKWIKACYLKQNLTELRFDPESVVVIRSNFSKPRTQAGAVDIEAAGRRFNDVNTPYSRTNATSRKSCSDLCRSDNSCLGYQLENDVCSRYAQIDNAIKDSKAQAGIKRQIAPDRTKH
jgi:serine/threonine protein kinase